MGIPKGEDLERAQAEVQWGLLNRGLSFYDDTPGCYWIGADPWDQMSHRGRAALRRIGGIEKLEKWARSGEWHFTKRDFIDSFLRHEHVEYVAALSRSSDRGRLTSAAEIVKGLLP